LKITGIINGQPVFNQEHRSFTISIVVFDARLADTDNTITRNELIVTNNFVFPFRFEIEIPQEVLDEDDRYALSVSIRDPNNNDLIWLTDTITLIEKSRNTYDLYLLKIGV
jgi:uncharacterized lipoprotein YbaY